MAIEKRYENRIPVSGDVYIRYRRGRVFQAKAVDCSANGMCLSTRNLSLPKGSLVELEIVIDGNSWHAKGVVVHAEIECLGIMFTKPQPVLYDVALLRSRMPQAPDGREEVSISLA